METQDARPNETTDADNKRLAELIMHAKTGSKSAMLEILHFFKDDIDRFARYTGCSFEDSKQALTLSLIELTLGDATKHGETL